ncbi:hypothetical protein ONZ45_g4865 [Pleurotus djamor]|nr:hypothetical protein ONZ45_g4865 [Pleurotus djamor]
MTEDMGKSATSIENAPFWLQDLNRALVEKRLCRGDRGELTSRVTYTVARDRAYLKVYGSLPTPDPELDGVLPGHEPVPLLIFLEFLFGDSWSTIKTATPCNLKDGQSLEAYFSKAVVDFTTFTITDDDDIFTLDGMISALRQGCAVVCKHGQETYDHVIVIVLDPEKDIGPDNIAILGDQTKNRAIATKLVISLGVVQADVPVITIINQHGHGHAASFASKSPTSKSPRFPPPKPHYQLYLRNCKLIPKIILQSLLEFDSPFYSYKKALSEDGTSSLGNYVSVRVDKLASNRYYGVSSNVRVLE